MKFFLDTAIVSEIKELYETGLVDGITTNPSLIAKSGREIKTVIAEICQIVDGPVSAEVIATDWQEMIKEGKELAEIAENVVVKLPITWDGLKACKALSEEDIMVNMTLCFTSNQALLAAKAGAYYVSPFVGRLDDIGQNGMGLIQEIYDMYSKYINLDTEILVASVRSPEHVAQAAQIGADIVTLPPSILRRLVEHPLTDAGLEIFLSDWKKAK